MERQRFVVHLPVMAVDLPGALRFAQGITRVLGFLADVDRAETTVSEEDAQCVRHRVFCDNLLDGRRRCLRPAAHDGPCV
ncbi:MULTISPECIES: hypothetical protein [unclassified Micromonospora]|uniref:hypothetical protein n=1 Tax=unclassified Micromonospora TaxID=2617518 RepID=UPI000EF4FEFE|nr:MULTISPECIES: hypothetical protein [unclassified Micromonospora]RLP85735.1 hypothetical protein EAD89_23155 [Micromonospora sp. BL4]RLP92382.1 hypothetical protein EAD98_21750 [Micromonospora sp. CV4]RLP92385.1 hypothetical protein EAD98_21865 [Micromonospora sp. CV4]